MATQGTPIRLGLVGIGKIACDQHIPAISADSRFVLAATASRGAQLDGVPAFATIEEMIGAVELDAVSICTPPEPRHEIAMTAIAAGLDTMLEKPPCATLSKIEDLRCAAEDKAVTLYATWHAREAAGVADARMWLSDKRIDAVRVIWREDIRHWHPGQEWILGPGGFGVFDPGINALSIVTHILPEPVLLDGAVLEVPEGRISPLRASLRMSSGKAKIAAEFDFLQTGPQTWDIEIDTDVGTLRLGLGGSVLTLPGAEPAHAPDREYPRLYDRFTSLIAARRSDVDVAPLRLVADAFLLGDRRRGEPFAF